MQVRSVYFAPVGGGGGGDSITDRRPLGKKITSQTFSNVDFRLVLG